MQVVGIKPATLSLPGMAVLTNQEAVCPPARVVGEFGDVASVDDAASLCRRAPACSHFTLDMGGSQAATSRNPRLRLWHAPCPWAVQQRAPGAALPCLRSSGELAAVPSEGPTRAGGLRPPTCCAPGGALNRVQVRSLPSRRALDMLWLRLRCTGGCCRGQCRAPNNGPLAATRRAEGRGNLAGLGGWLGGWVVRGAGGRGAGWVGGRGAARERARARSCSRQASTRVVVRACSVCVCVCVCVCGVGGWYRGWHHAWFGAVAGGQRWRRVPFPAAREAAHGWLGATAGPMRQSTPTPPGAWW